MAEHEAGPTMSARDLAHALREELRALPPQDAPARVAAIVAAFEAEAHTPRLGTLVHRALLGASAYARELADKPHTNARSTLKGALSLVVSVLEYEATNPDDV